MYRLEGWSYVNLLVAGPHDWWVLKGYVYSHPRFEDGLYVRISRPVAFDEVNMVITTHSGSQYKLGICCGNLAKQMDYIREDIADANSER